MLRQGRRLPPLHLFRPTRRLPATKSRTSAAGSDGRHSTRPKSWAAAAPTPSPARRAAAAAPTPHFRVRRRRPPLPQLPRDGWRLPPLAINGGGGHLFWRHRPSGRRRHPKPAHPRRVAAAATSSAPSSGAVAPTTTSCIQLEVIAAAAVPFLPYPRPPLNVQASAGHSAAATAAAAAQRACKKGWW